MIIQNWFKYRLGAIRQQAITWTIDEQDLCCHMTSLGNNELNLILPKETKTLFQLCCEPIPANGLDPLGIRDLVGYDDTLPWKCFKHCWPGLLWRESTSYYYMQWTKFQIDIVWDALKLIALWKTAVHPHTSDIVVLHKATEMVMVIKRH